MFDGLTRHEVRREGVDLAVWSVGEGTPVVLLHGYPQSSYMWRELVPGLAGDHRLILLDLRGYGRSSAPASDPGDAIYSKRAMAADVATALDVLGIDRAHLVGHDRGGRVVHRFCLDYPELVGTAAVLDIVPTAHMFTHVDRAMADSYFHWFFLTRGGGLPEALLRADPGAWIRSRLIGRHGPGFEFPPDAVAEYLAAFNRPGVIEATCADYRAAATVDLVHDEADRRAGRRIEAPLLAGWGTRSYVGTHFDVTRVWQEWARTVIPAPIDADHYVAEENPMQTMQALRSFWSQA